MPGVVTQLGRFCFIDIGSRFFLIVNFQWRLQRGEAGASRGPFEGKAFTLTTREVEAKCFHLEYDVAADRYSRPVDGSTLSGWKNGVKECESVMRKEERDWKMVYLARTGKNRNDIIPGP